MSRLNPEELTVVSFETELEIVPDPTPVPATGDPVGCDSPFCAVTIDRTCPHHGC